jgi:nicotinamidase/pyrazinamidase
MRALLIVDIQNDFLPGGALAIKEGDKIIPIINELQKKFQVVLASKDWHPSHHVSFANEHGKTPYEVIEVQGGTQELWPVHCVRETYGAEFSKLLEPEKISHVFYKGVDPDIDSYSAFYDNAHLRSTGLKEYLKEFEIDEIYIVGLATEYCVKFSAKDAIKLGIKTWVVIDGCKGVDLKPGDSERALEEMISWGAHLISSHSL